MLYLAIKAAVSGIVVAIASEIARRSPALGALIVSLPLVSILTVLWLWHDTGSTARIADHAQSTFWFVLPSLPGFLLLAAMLRAGWPFWGAMSAAAILTVVLYLAGVAVLSRIGISL
jgi:hypothetical protein